MEMYWLAIQEETEKGKFYAYVKKVHSFDNLQTILFNKNIVSSFIFNSKKEADYAVKNWNIAFKMHDKSSF